MKLVHHSIVSDFTSKTRHITVTYECDLSEPIDVHKLEARLAEICKPEQAPARPVSAPKLNVDAMLDAHPIRATALIAADLDKEPEAPPAPVDPRTMFIRSINQHFAKIDLSGKQEVLDAVLDGEQQFLEGSKAMKCLRELDVAMVAAVADRLSLEVDVAAQYIEVHRKTKQTSVGPSTSLEELWKQTMAKPQVQSKSAPIQKMVAALALMTAQDGKTTIADMQAKADELSKVVGSAEEWAALNNPSVGSSSLSKTKLQVLAPIIGNTVGVKVV